MGVDAGGRRASLVVLGIILTSSLLLSRPAAGQKGLLDPSFGGDGIVTTDFGLSPDFAVAVAVQADGCVIVAGMPALARYLPNGDPDPSFGQNGHVLTYAWTADVAVDSNGRILVAGTSYDREIVVSRYTSEGELDVSFGDGGTAVAAFTALATARAMALGPDGNVTVAGSVERAAGADFALARFDAEGRLDASFGDEGRLTTDFGMEDTVSALALAEDGGVVAAGTSEPFHGAGTLAAARYDASGDLVASWGDGGRLRLPSPTGVSVGGAAVFDGEGRLLLGGGAMNGYDNRFWVVRLNGAGAIDPTFGGPGGAVVNFPVAPDPVLQPASSVVRGLAVLPNGVVVAAGGVYVDFVEYAAYGVLYLTPEGVPDPAFGTSGRVVTDLPDRDDRMQGMALAPNGRVYLTGLSTLGDYVLLAYRTTMPGDANGDDAVNVIDVFFLINDLFAGGPPSRSTADANGDAACDVADVFYLINYLFAGAAPPK